MRSTACLSGFRCTLFGELFAIFFSPYFRLFLFQPSLHTSLEHFPKFCQSQIENIEVSRAHGLHCFRIVNVFGLPKGIIVQLQILARCLHNRSKGCCGVAVAKRAVTWKRSQLFKATLESL